MKAMIVQHETYSFQLRVWLGDISEGEARKLIATCGWRFKGPYESYSQGYSYFFFVYKPWGKNDLRAVDFAGIVKQAAWELDIGVSQILYGDEVPDQEYDLGLTSQDDDQDEEDQEDGFDEPIDEQDDELNDEDEEPCEDGDEDYEANTDDHEDDSDDEYEDGEEEDEDAFPLRQNDVPMDESALDVIVDHEGGDGHTIDRPAAGQHMKPHIDGHHLEEIADRMEELHSALQPLIHQVGRSKLDNYGGPIMRIRRLAGDIFAETTLSLISLHLLSPTEETLRTAIQISPNALLRLDESSVDRLAQWAVHVLQNHPDLVVRLLEPVPQKTNEMKLHLAQAYLELGQVEDLMVIAKQLEDQGYRLSEVYHLLALAFKDLEPHLAESYIKKAVQANPNNRQAVKDAVEIIRLRDELLAFLDQHLERLSSGIEMYRSRDLYEEKVRCLVEYSGVSNRALVDAILDLMEAYGFAEERCWSFYEQYARKSNLSSRDLMDILTSMGSGNRVLKEIENLALSEIGKSAGADATVIEDACIALQASGREDGARELWELYMNERCELEKKGMFGSRAEPAQLFQHLAGVDQWPSLMDHRVAIVGGTQRVREKVVDILKRHCHLRSVAEVPPSWERNLSQSDVDRLLRGATFVVVITGAMKHLTSNMVSNWEKRQRHNPRMVFPRGRGVSGIIASILHHAAQP
ncbi:hypothetical protein [Thermaerobacter litoralis]